MKTELTHCDIMIQKNMNDLYNRDITIEEYLEVSSKINNIRDGVINNINWITNK